MPGSVQASMSEDVCKRHEEMLLRQAQLADTQLGTCASPTAQRLRDSAHAIDNVWAKCPQSRAPTTVAVCWVHLQPRVTAV